MIFELRNMQDRINNHIKDNEYIYPNVYKAWVKRFNDLVGKYNSKSSNLLQPFIVDDWDYSSTQKTIKKSAVEFLITTLGSLISRFEVEIETLRKQELDKQVPFYQLRHCFKLRTDGCPVNPKYERNKIFIGMPFSNDYTDSYNYGIKPAIESMGYDYYRADQTISNLDIMCKICREIQSCGLAVFNISDLNPNVMLELGLAYGIGKPVIIVKDKKTRSITDIGSIEYIEYEHAYDLMQKLINALESIK